MNKASLLAAWDMMRLRHGIALRLIESLPADKLDANPIPNMRTPKQLVVHTYQFLRMAPTVVLAGTLMNGPDEAATVAGIQTRDQLLAFARQAWAEADAAVAKLTDAQLAASVATPWGEPYPGAVILGFVPDEFLHHRGQLYAFARALGVDPVVMMWDFEHNAPEFQKKAPAAS